MDQSEIPGKWILTGVRSTWFGALRNGLADLGLDGLLNSAKVAGQGSGWFVNPVTGYSSPSLSIEYQRGRQQQEIAEIGMMDTVRSDFRGQVGCIGLERVAWAQTGQMFSWEQRLPSLLAAIRAEAQARALPLPIGYTNFLESV